MKSLNISGMRHNTVSHGTVQRRDLRQNLPFFHPKCTGLQGGACGARPGVMKICLRLRIVELSLLSPPKTVVIQSLSLM